jgi:steroid delta-isomerase-like uncharacterized protein
MGTNTDIADAAIAAFNRGDIEGYCATYADDAVLTSPDGTFTGREAITQNWVLEHQSFPDEQVTVSLTVEDGDRLIQEWTWRATNTGDLTLPDGTVIPATGKTVEVDGARVVVMRDGKIVSERMYFDNVAAYSQLGLLPANA